VLFVEMAGHIVIASPGTHSFPQ